MYTKLCNRFFVLVLLIILFPVSVQAQVSDRTAILAQIQQLISAVHELQLKLAALRSGQGSVVSSDTGALAAPDSISDGTIEAFAPSATQPCGDSRKSTNTRFITTTLPGISENPSSAPITCVNDIPEVPYDPYLLGFKTHDNVQIGIGQGGQIYSITMPGVTDNIIPPRQHYDSHWNDRTLLMTVTPGSGLPQTHPGGNFFYHQSGTYSRGPLKATDPAFYSPLMHRSFNSEAGYSETLNLAQMSHIDNSEFIPDRIPMYTKYRHIGDNIFEVTALFFNHTTGEELEPYTKFSRFSIPWFTVHADSLPKVYAYTQDGELIKELENIIWPNENTQLTKKKIAWVGAFTTGSGMAPGIAMTLPEESSSILFKTGKVTKDQEVISVDAKGNQILGEENWHIWSVTERLSETEAQVRGDVVMARFYLLFGERNTDIAQRAQQLSRQSFVRKIEIPQSNSVKDVVDLCLNDEGRYGRCNSTFTKHPIGLSRTWCGDCLPVYEVFEHAAKRYHYSTDPYMGETDHSYLTDKQYTIRRIVGWLYVDPSNIPAGYRAFEAIQDAKKKIKTHSSDAGQYYLLKDM